LVCEMLTITFSAPISASRACAPRYSRTCGAPASSEKISISASAKPSKPVPSALLTASLAAQKPAAVCAPLRAMAARSSSV